MKTRAGAGVQDNIAVAPCAMRPLLSHWPDDDACTMQFLGSASWPSPTVTPQIPKL